MKEPERISVRGTRQGLECRTGRSLSPDGGSSAVELFSNGYTAVRHIRNGTSPGAAVKNVVARIKDIDAMMVERDALMKK